MATKRRAETAQENREKLIHAARKAFAEKGFAAASGKRGVNARCAVS